MGGERSNLIGCCGIGAGVSSQASQFLLHAEVRALAHAEEGGGHGQRHQDEEHAEDGEQQELARLHPGLLHHRDLSQAASLEETKDTCVKGGRGKKNRRRKKKGHSNFSRHFIVVFIRISHSAVAASLSPDLSSKHCHPNKLFLGYTLPLTLCLHPQPLPDPSLLISRPQ